MGVVERRVLLLVIMEIQVVDQEETSQFTVARHSGSRASNAISSSDTEMKEDRGVVGLVTGQEDTARCIFSCSFRIQGIQCQGDGKDCASLPPK